MRLAVLRLSCRWFVPVLLVLFVPAAGARAAAVSEARSPIEIRGWVSGDDAADRAGVTVTLEPVLDDYRRELRLLAGHSGPEPVDTYRTREDGAFLLVAPEPGMWRVVVEAPGEVPAERRLVPLFSDVTLPALELPAAEPLTVTVVDAEGRPVTGARVRWTTDSSSPLPRELGARGWSLHGRGGVTDGSGRLDLPRVEEEAGLVRAWRAGYLPSEPVAVQAGDGEAVTLRLSRGRERVLTVLDPAGRPLADVLVALGDAGIGTTDAEGRLAAALPEEGDAELVLDAGSGWRQSSSLRLAPGGDPAELTMEAPLLLTGRVVDAEEETPLVRALVWPRGEPGAAVTSDGDGTYEMVSGTPPDEVAAGAAGFRVAGVRTDPSRPARLPLLRLPPEVTVRGTVVDAEGGPVSGARVRLRAPAQPGITWKATWGREAPGGSSDERGRFRVAGLDTGTVYLLRVEAPGFPALERAVEPPAQLALTLERGGGVTGVLADPYGEPVVGARARLFPAPDEANRLVVQLLDGERVARYEAVTGAQGRFTVTEVAAGAYDLWIEAPGLAPVRRMGVEVPGGELQRLGRLVADPAVAVEGRVVDAEGEPVEGARVSVDPFSPYRDFRGSRSVYVFSPGGPAGQVRGGVSDDEGWFRLDGLAAGEPVDLNVEHERHPDRKLSGVEPPVDGLEIELEAGVRVRGRVLGPFGEPVPRAMIRISGDQNRTGSAAGPSYSFGHSAITDEDGRFDEAGLRPGVFRVEASSGEMSPATAGPFTVGEGEEIGPLELVLGEPVVLEGTVYGADGQPVPGVAVTTRRTVQTRNGAITARHGARTDATGRYRIPGLPPGEHSVRVEQGTARAEATVEMTERSQRLDLQLEEHRALTGRVVRSDGTPAVEPRIGVHPPEDGDEAHAVTLRGEEDGSFAWSDPPPGTYRLVATAGDERGTREIAVGGEPPRDLLVQLQPGAEVRGRIDGVEPSDLHRVQVSARPEGGGRLRFGRADHRGDYRVGGLAPGRWTVTARLPGEGRAEGEVEIDDPRGSAWLDLDLGDSGTVVFGRVTLDGVPLADARVVLVPADAEESAPRSTGTSHDGRFRIAGLEAGRHRVRVLGPFAAPRWLREVDLSGEEELFLDLEGVEVSGRVLAPDGTPVENAEVALGPPGDEPGVRPLEVWSDELGRFRIPEALPGSYRLRVAAPGFEPAETALQVGVLDVVGVEVLLGR